MKKENPKTEQLKREIVFGCFVIIWTSWRLWARNNIENVIPEVKFESESKYGDVRKIMIIIYFIARRTIQMIEIAYFYFIFL